MTDRRRRGIVWAVSRVLSSLALLFACGGQPSPIARAPEREPDGLDRCLGDKPEPMDPSPIRETWERLVRGEPATPLHLRRFSAGQCKETWWTPVEPLAICGIAEPRERALPMLDAGTVVVDIATGKLSLRPAGEELFEIDGHLVSRRDGHVWITTARGRTVVPGFPQHVIDDDHAIISTDHGMVVWHLPTNREALPIRPRKLAGDKATRIAATEVIRAPTSALGARVLAGVVFDEESEAFAIDPRGALLASVRTASVAYPVATPEGAMVLVGYRSGTLEIKTVGGTGKVATRSLVLDAGPIEHLLRLDVMAAGEVVVVGFAARAVIVRGGAAPVIVDTKHSRRMVPVLLAGGNVAVIAGDDGTVAIDTRSGAELARVTDYQPRFTIGAAAAVLVDPQAANGQYAIIVSADGSVRRGPVGETKVGRYTVQTFAGIPDPAKACDARALSMLPPLLRYGDSYLPADLVVD